MLAAFHRLFKVGWLAAYGNLLAMPMIQGRNRIIENQCRLVGSLGQLRQECRECNATLLSFTGDVHDFAATR